MLYALVSYLRAFIVLINSYVKHENRWTSVERQQAVGPADSKTLANRGEAALAKTDRVPDDRSATRKR